MKFVQEKPVNGVVCNYAIADHFKSSLFSVDLILPLTAENATGMSLLAEVMARGCAQYPGVDLIARFLARNYGATFSISASKAGECEFLNFTVSGMDNEYAIENEDIRGNLIAFLYEIVFNPLIENGAFLKSHVEQEKINLADKINGLFNDKRVYSLLRCKEIMCAEEAYGISGMGDCETIKSFDEKSLYAFYHKMLDEAFVVVSYVGKETGLLKSLAEAFEPRCDEVPVTSVLPAGDSVREVIEPMDLNQSKLNLGFRMGPTALENRMACRLFNVLYGGSANSKLFMNVRERLSLCYYCSSTVDRQKNVMFVSSGVEAEKYEEARREIEAQLESIAVGDFSEDEFHAAKEYLRDTIISNGDNKEQLSSAMLAGTIIGDIKIPALRSQEVDAVTREQVMQIAKETTLDTVYLLKGVHNEE